LIELGKLWAASDYTRSGALLTEALAVARQLDDRRLIAHSLNRIGNWQVNTEHPRQALPLHREALSIFESLGDRAGIATTLDLLGIAAYLAADLAEAIDVYGRAAALFAELDDRHGLISSLTMLALRGGCFELGSATADATTIRAGVRDGQQAIELAQASGWRSGEAFALQIVAGVEMLQGNYAVALDQARQSLRISEEIGHHQWRVGAYCVLGCIYLDLLALTQARTHLQRALSMAREVRSSFWVQMVAGCLGYVYVLDGELDRAAALLGPVPEIAVPVQSLGERWVNYAQVHLALARGDARLALELATRATPSGLDGVPTPETPRPALARAEALIGLGRDAEARHVLDRVEGIARRQEARPLLWRCLQARGNMLIARGCAAEGSRDLATARAIIDELAAGLDLDVRQELLIRAGLAAAAPDVGAARGPLSARELEVARLVAVGLTNREIAERLVISKWTADNHVANILRKLDLARRAQVATWLAGAERGS
jgi:DNA-binding CsgD family transcriptional regulator